MNTFIFQAPLLFSGRVMRDASLAAERKKAAQKSRGLGVFFTQPS